jgi:hypothetical protein
MQLTNPDFKPEPKPAIFAACGITWVVSSIMYASMVVMTGYDGSIASLSCIAVVCWMGFSLPPIVMTHIFEDRNMSVCWLSALYHLCAFVLMAGAHWLL